MKLNSLSIAVLVAALQLQAGPAAADEAVGAYLAARQARYQNDFTAAAEHFTRALAKDPSNPALMENAIAAFVGLGQIEKALPVAQRIEDADLLSQVAHMVLIADEGRREAFDELLARVDRKRGVGELADGLLAAWAHMGKGDMKTALELFDEVATQRGLHSFALYHKALALASVGDFESSEKIFAGDADGPMQRTRRGTMAWAQVLSQLERNDDAVAVIDDVFGTDMDPEIEELRDQLTAGERLPFSIITGARDGVSEVFYSLGRALQVDAGQDYVLLYARVAEYLTPDNVDAIIMTAELLENLQRYELATSAYRRVPRDHPSYYIAELGRAEALRRSGKTDAAIEVLEQLSQTHGDVPVIHVSAGDLYRQLERYDDAVNAYDKALDLYVERDNDQWFVHYARGIAHERLDQWEEAEADFRKSLELNPEHPQVLNYLGYSMVEKRINLDEALDMIERAVAARPDSGYILDSLGWVLYRLGRYDEAIGHMERAAELEPVDPTVNDHLGDVLWAVGRNKEAQFQWHRALSFIDAGDTNTDIDPDRIRRKLEVGLDKVLEEEGSAPLKVVKEFAPAKVNLTLHVTGQRQDGYHLLDSLVMFADVGDRISVRASDTPIMIIKGPMADGLPRDRSNMVARAADAMGVSAHIQLEKNLPHAAGIGGGSSDAAATFRALSSISGKPIPSDLLAYGADVPVCMHGRAARMQGIGNEINPVPDLPALHAVLVNPKLPVLTAEVFKRLRNHNNPPMPDDLPESASARDLITWLSEMRNDLQEAAIEAEPIIEHVFNTLAVTPGCLMTRMSGSGGTCFGLYGDAETAASAAGRLHQDYPGWWVAATRLNA